MKHFRLLSTLFCAGLFALVATSCSKAPATTEEVGPYTVQTITDQVYHIEDFNTERPRGDYKLPDGTPTQNNCSDIYLVVGKESALLIDLSNRLADTTAAASLRKIVYDRIGKRELIITITHNHGDHLGMMAAFHDDERARFWIPEADFKNSKAFPESRTELFADGATIDLGGKSITTLTIAGHTTGSTVFFLDGQDLCFTGDAIGSGNGVWIFSYESFRDQYVGSVEKLISYIEDPANGIDSSKLVFWGGHDWQKGALPKLDMQYLYDMRTLIGQLAAGTADYDPQAYNARLNANYKYGTAKITWHTDHALRYAEEMKAAE